MPDGFIVTAIKSLVLVNLVMLTFAVLTWAERRLIGRFQVRLGPNRVGPIGLLQPIADLGKLLRKESIIPIGSSPFLYLAAPAVSLFAALSVFGVIPFGESATIPIIDYQIYLYIADINVALLLVFALGSFSFYGFLVGGWSSSSKYSLYGSMRAVAQLISYEVALTMAVIGVVMMSQSLSLIGIVQAQQADGVWYIVPQFFGFVIYVLASTAEVSRIPFDLPEAEGELVAGYHTEYGGMRWAMFQNAEYVATIAFSALASILFLGGYDGPWLPGPIWMLLKMAFFIFLLIWIRSTLPRVRYDRLMTIGWKVLLPAATLNLVVTAILVERIGVAVAVVDTVRGFGVTFRHLFRKPVTQQFPEYKRPVYPRFRGRHRLHRHDNGLEKCVGCSLCAAACPADCIRVVAAENTPEARFSAGERYARIYEINMSRCIFCGYCEIACPFDAITLGNDYELAEMSRDAMVYTKEMLLAPQPEPRRTPVAPADEFDTVGEPDA